MKLLSLIRTQVYNLVSVRLILDNPTVIGLAASLNVALPELQRTRAESNAILQSNKAVMRSMSMVDSDGLLGEPTFKVGWQNYVVQLFIVLGLQLFLGLGITLTYLILQFLPQLTTPEGPAFLIYLQYALVFFCFYVFLAVFYLGSVFTFKMLFLGRRSERGAFLVNESYFYRIFLMQKLWMLTSMFAHIFVGTKFYNAYLRLLGMKIGKNVVIHTTFIDLFDQIEIDDDTFIGSRVRLKAVQRQHEIFSVATVKIGARCVISDRSVIANGAIIEDDCHIIGMSCVDDFTSVAPRQKWENYVVTQLALERGLSRPLSFAQHVFQSLILALTLFLLSQPTVLTYYFFSEVFQGSPLLFLITMPLWWSVWRIGHLIFGLILIRTICGNVPPKAKYKINSWSYMRKVWLREHWFSNLCNGLDMMSFSPVLVFLLRCMGAKIGKDVQIAGPVSSGYMLPLNLLTMEDGCMTATDVAVGAPRIENGFWEASPVCIGKGAFAGNYSMLDGNIPANSIIGSVTNVIPGKYDDASVLLGCPARQLPMIMPAARENQEEDQSSCGATVVRNTMPVLKLVLAMLFLAPSGIIFTELSLYLDSDWRFLFYPAFITSGFVTLTIGTLLCKWVFVGRFRPGAHDMGTWWFVRRLLAYCLVDFWISFGGFAILGTVYNSWFHKLLGLRVGTNVILEGLVSEVDLVEIGDNTIVEEGAQVQPHTFENRLMQCRPISVGRNCILGSNCVILPGVNLEHEVEVNPNTLVMKGEDLPSDSRWGGCPSVYLPARKVAMVEIEAHTRIRSFNPWKALTAGLMLLLCSGLATSLPMYEDELKAALVWEDAGLLSGLLVLAHSFALFAGVLYDWAGPRPTIIIGILLSGLGYIFLYLAVANSVSWELKLLSAFSIVGAGLGSSFLGVPTLFANAKNFPPERRGAYFGLANAFINLASLAWGLMYHGFGLKPLPAASSTNLAKPLLYLTFITALGPLICLWFIRTLAPGGNPKGNRPISIRVALDRCYVVTILLAALLTTLDLVPEWNEGIAYGTLGALVLVLLLVRNMPPVMIEAFERLPADTPLLKNVKKLKFWLLFMVTFTQAACWAGMLLDVFSPELLGETCAALAFGCLISGILLDYSRISDKVLSLMCLGASCAQFSMLVPEQDASVSLLAGGFFFGAFMTILHYMVLKMSGSQYIGRTYGLMSVAVSFGYGSVGIIVYNEVSFSSAHALYGGLGALGALLSVAVAFAQKSTTLEDDGLATIRASMNSLNAPLLQIPRGEHGLESWSRS